MTAEDFFSLLVPVTFFVFLAIESLFKTGRPWPSIRWWRVKGVLFFLVVGTINALLPSLVPPDVAGHHLVDASRLGLAGSIVLGYLVLSLATATIHRGYHRYPLLWRYVHQLHHAPQRLDTPGAVLFTPQEIVVNVAVSVLVLVFLLGLSPLAAAITGYVAVFYSLFQHFNVNTPRWLGWLIQRPESHGVHHRRGFHAYNYSDLPIWDMLWGTFRNPERFMGDVGFEEAESQRFGAMLLAKDVNVAALGPGNRGRADARDESRVKLDSDDGRRLADSIEARAMADMYAAAPRALELSAETVAGATLLLAPRIPASYFNRAIGLGVFEPATERALDQILERFAAARVSDYWLHLNPVAQPAQIADWLATRRLAPPPRRTWAKFLRSPEHHAAPPSPLSVRPAERSDAAAIAQIVCAAFGMPETLAPWFAALVGRPGWHFVVAETDDRIAATGAAFLAGTTAWVGVGATLAAYRNRGAQGALLAARVALAAGAGCTVLATETGESIAGEVNPSLNNIRRAGFVQVCSRLNYAAGG